MSDPKYQAAPPAPEAQGAVPGKTLGIVGLILAIVSPLIGLILSIIAHSQSKAFGVPNGPAKAGIIVGIIMIVLIIVGTILLLIIAPGLIKQILGM